MARFRVLRTQRVAEVGFLAIDEVEVEAPDGEHITRTVVRHPGAVVVVPIERGGADGGDDVAVLVRQYRAAVDEDVLEVVAGKRDVEGEAPATTAARELEEELGLHAGRLVKLAEFFNTPGFCDEHSFLFAALDCTPAARNAPTSAEEREMTTERVALRDVEGLIADGTLHDAKSIIGLLLARQYLAGVLPGRDVDVV
jgi:8-oxo-dGTP pyrophosphatase MutT (NUDIX family)